jgi:hypothetical protein
MWLIVVVALASGLGVEHFGRVRTDQKNADLTKQLEHWPQLGVTARNENAQLKLIAHKSSLSPIDLGALEIAKPGEPQPTAEFAPTYVWVKSK